MLHALRSDTDKVTSRIACQKLVHAHPSDVWSLATLTSLLDGHPLKVKYQQLVLLQGEKGETAATIVVIAIDSYTSHTTRVL